MPYGFELLPIHLTCFGLWTFCKNRPMAFLKSWMWIVLNALNVPEWNEVIVDSFQFSEHISTISRICRKGLVRTSTTQNISRRARVWLSAHQVFPQMWSKNSFALCDSWRAKTCRLGRNPARSFSTSKSQGTYSTLSNFFINLGGFSKWGSNFN